MRGGVASAFTSCSEQGAELPGKLFGVSQFLQPLAPDFALSLWAHHALPHLLASLHRWLTGRSGSLLSFPSRVEVGSWSPSLLLGAGILEPWLRLSPNNPGWRSSRGQMRKRWLVQNPCAIEIFLPEKWEGGGAPASLAAVAACFHCDANLFV